MMMVVVVVVIRFLYCCCNIILVRFGRCYCYCHRQLMSYVDLIILVTVLVFIHYYHFYVVAYLFYPIVVMATISPHSNVNLSTFLPHYTPSFFIQYIFHQIVSRSLSHADWLILTMRNKRLSLKIMLYEWTQCYLKPLYFY